MMGTDLFKSEVIRLHLGLRFGLLSLTRTPVIDQTVRVPIQARIPDGPSMLKQAH